MFITVKKFKEILTTLLNNEGADKKAVAVLKNELADLQLKKRIEEEEIKHLVKMKEEKLAIEATKKELELQKKFQEKEVTLQTTYHERILRNIEDSRKESKELYTAIMERLPNVNVKMRR